MASKKKDVRPVITLACTECKERNYTSEKNRRNDPGPYGTEEVSALAAENTRASRDEITRISQISRA